MSIYKNVSQITAMAILQSYLVGQFDSMQYQKISVRVITSRNKSLSNALTKELKTINIIMKSKVRLISRCAGNHYRFQN